MAPPRLHLVDGTYELFRAFYGKRPDHRTPDGQPAKAVVGLAGSLLSLLDDEAEAVTHLAVAFDRPIESFRNEVFAGYKTGEGMDPELVAQMVPAEEAVRALGIPVWVMDRWEADDALASAAARFAGEVRQVRLLTPDKDLAQCVVGDEVVQVDRLRETVRTAEGVKAKFGVDPASIPDWLALVGDAADGIPGIPGFGAKTAATLLAYYGHLEAIPDDALAWSVKVRGADKLAKTLRERREDAGLYKRLATLATDVPLAESLADLAWRGVPRARFEAWCEQVGSRTLAGRARHLTGAG